MASKTKKTDRRREMRDLNMQKRRRKKFRLALKKKAAKKS